MDANPKQTIIRDFEDFLMEKAFPCAGAKAAIAKHQLHCMVVDHLACPKDNREILEFLYSFIDSFRKSDDLFHSAAIIFQSPEDCTEEQFEKLFWQRLQSLSELDAMQYEYDPRVSSDPSSEHFSFSIKREACFIIGIHPGSNRQSRKYKYPVMVFNPHQQFEKLRETNRYDHMKDAIRKHDILYSGSVNPMLADFGELPETFQYSGKQYDASWQCPLKIIHGKHSNHSTT